MTKNEIIKKIQEEEDFINLPRCENSLRVFETKYPDGAKDEVVAKALMLSEDELKEKFDAILAKIRDDMNIEDMGDLDE